ncbi:MAG: hypothetical protein NT007_03750 [Candidatus Kapabacteria bacterium]|nr:hypothetical protein [Candidatus Kapabacteria bacterium]
MTEKQKPRILVLGGNKDKWSSKSRPEMYAYTTGVESWALACDGDYNFGLNSSLKEINSYDIVIGNTNFGKATAHLRKLAESRNSNVKWVSLIEGDATYYLKPRENIRELFDCSDLIITLNKLTDPIFRHLTNSKVEFIGIPYPVESISQKTIPIEKREKKIYINPFLRYRWNDYLVAKNIGFPYFGFDERVSRKPKNYLKMLKASKSLNPLYMLDEDKIIYNDPDLGISTVAPLHEYFDIVNKSYLWINMDNRYTWGRYVLDAAALQIPIITTKSTGHGSDLFPLTTLDNEFELDKAIELRNRLMSDTEFYEEVSKFPIGKIDQYSYLNMRNKLFKTLGIS